MENNHKGGQGSFVDEVNQAFQKQETERQQIEFARYKQDCRKRAMDLAHNEVNSPLAKKYAEQNEPLDILLVADKYYNWLISIPE